MIKQKVLIISTYPVLHAHHGGQKRARAIFDLYKANFIDAKYIGVFHRGQYPEWGPDDLPLGDPDLIAMVDSAPYASELIVGEAIDKDIHVRSPMAKILMEYSPEIIHIEQPFPYIGLRVLLKELGLRPIIVFGSQNIEYDLKKRIFEEFKVGVKIKKSFLLRTIEIEETLSKEADIVIAVNKADAESHIKLGAQICIVAHNGISRVSFTPESNIFWTEYKKKNGIKNISLFVGSGHPPNWEGFLELVGDDTSFMPDGSKILVAGGVADFFRTKYVSPKHSPNFFRGLYLIGDLSEDRLAALLNISDTILLPITTKRGSNLKTAEAVLSGKKVVSSKFAFNGFEKFKHLPNIQIGSDGDEFRRLIVDSVKAPYKERSNREIDLAETVQWEYSLSPIIKTIKKFINKKKRRRIIGSVARKMRVRR